MLPHVAARKTHQPLQEFWFDTPKRLLQQYLPIGDLGSPISSRDRALINPITGIASCCARAESGRKVARTGYGNTLPTWQSAISV